MATDISNKKFNKLTAIRLIEVDKYYHQHWLFVCDCGNETVARKDAVTRGTTTSCGCYNKELSSKNAKIVGSNNLIHGMSKTRFYQCWNQMFYRPYNVTICDRWLDFENFKDDMYDEYLKHVEQFGEKNTSIDRIDNSNGEYCKENCRWATPKIQANNRSSTIHITYKGRTKSLTEWSDELGIKYTTIKARYYAGWSINKLLTI